MRRFQRRSGLTVDGIVGPKTLAALGISADVGAVEHRVGTPPRRGDASATLQKIAQCESGGDPTAVSADGAYRGKYQFDRATWQQLGGSGDPAAAPESEQDQPRRPSTASAAPPWPNCAAPRPASAVAPTSHPASQGARQRPSAGGARALSRKVASSRASGSPSGPGAGSLVLAAALGDPDEHGRVDVEAQLVVGHDQRIRRGRVAHPDDARRHAAGDGVGGHVLGDDRARADDRVVADGHAAQEAAP